MGTFPTFFWGGLLRVCPQRIGKPCKVCYLTLLMSAKKPDGEKAVPTGISLPGDLIIRAKAYAAAGGYGGLSGLARHLITTHLAKAAQAAEDASQQAEAKGKKQVSSAAGKLRKRRKNEE